LVSPSVQFVSPIPCPPNPLTAFAACLGVIGKGFNVVAKVSNVVRLNTVGVPLNAAENEFNALFNSRISLLSILPDLSTTNAISSPHESDKLGLGTGGSVSV